MTENREQTRDIDFRVPEGAPERLPIENALREKYPEVQSTFPDMNYDKRKGRASLAQIEFGRKRLELAYIPKINQALTHIKNTQPESSRRENETTVVYQVAKELMAAIATKNGEALNYDLITKNPAIAGWASEKGKEIFDWQQSFSSEHGSSAVYTFRTKIFPND